MTKNGSGKIFSITDRVQSIRYAVQGIAYMLKKLKGVSIALIF